MYDWSEEQLTIFSTATATSDNGFKHPLIKIEAVAGAAKSSSLVELANRYPQGTSISYLVFGNANAAEARSSFKHMAKVSTLHALAYHYIFNKYSFNVRRDVKPYIAYNSIPKTLKVPYRLVADAVTLVNGFCESNILSMTEFASDAKPALIKYATSIMNAMVQGDMPITHGAYLKLFHSLVMTGEILIDPVDVLMIDEFGDITQQTIDIFLAYPAKQKIAVGDTAQSIFDFMGCVNGFKLLANRGITLHLSKSFRVSEYLAPSIEYFCKRTIDKSFIFNGMAYTEIPNVMMSTAYITRNNSALIDKMIELNKAGTAYRLITKAKTDQLFKLPLFLLSPKAGRVYKDKELASLQYHVDQYFKYKADNSPSLRSYILSMNKDHPTLQQAARTLMKFSASDIIEAKNTADLHKKSNAKYILGTAFVFKGLTVDEVHISQELNNSVSDAMQALAANEPLTEDQRTDCKLYYVACTRARYKITNGVHL